MTVALHLRQNMGKECAKCGQKLSVDGHNYPRVHIVKEYEDPVKGYAPCVKVNKPKPKVDPNNLPF